MTSQTHHPFQFPQTWLITAVLLLTLGSARGWPGDLFVAPNGNDEWSGAIAEPNAAKSDGPLATIARAQVAVRKLRAHQPARRRPLVVQLRGGTYALARPLIWEPRDSGTAQSPTIYEAFPGEKPILSGGVRVTGWQRHDERLWTAELRRESSQSWPLCQLFVNDARRPRARTPSVGKYFYTKRLMLTPATHPICRGLIFKPGDLQPWKDADDPVVVLFHNWVNSFNYVGSVDWARRRLTFERPAGAFFLGPEIRYYVENTFEALDAPGEWLWDRSASRLFYYPLKSEDITQTEVVAPILRQTLVQLVGDPNLGLYVEYLVFRGLSFQHVDADLAREHPHSVQGAVHQRGALFAVGMRHCLIEACEFVHLGEHAVSLRQGCQHNTIRRCHIHDVGGGGVYLSEGLPAQTDDGYLTGHNTVDNNFIHDGGHLFRAGCGVFLGGSASYNQITHNEICDLSWMGVHLGWSWTGRASTYTHHNTVAYNHIHHLGNGVLNDIGGIYTLGVSPGTVLHHNLIHDVTRFERGREGYGGWGIYLDAGSSQMRVENNVVYNTRDGGLHVHCFGYPYSDQIVNNIFAYADVGQLMRNANHEPQGNHVNLERNIVYNANPLMFGGNNWKAGSKFTSDRNCFWSESSEAVDFYGGSFANWQAQGHDASSLVADPRFVNAPGRDFRLQPDSPALTLGFVPIDISTAGLHGPTDWCERPLHFTHRVFEAAVADDGTKPFVDDFEDYDVGETPDGGVAPEGDACVAITDQTAISGKQCIRFDDAAGATAWKPHWYANRKLNTETVRFACAVKNDRTEPATIDLELREWHVATAGGRYRTGPHLRFFPDGTVKTAGRAGGPSWTPLGIYPLGEWFRVEIEFVQGADKPKYCRLRMVYPSASPQSWTEVPFRHSGFTQCTWAGFSGADNQRAVFYIDDVRFE